MIFKNTKSPVALREILVALGVGIVFIILGGIFDFKFTSAVYDPVNTSYFGIILAGICELPVCLGLSVAGALFFKGRVRQGKPSLREVICIALSFLSTGLSVYFVYDTFCDIYGFANTSHLETLIKILGIIFALVFTALVIFVTIKLTKNVESKRLLRVAMVVACTCFASVLLLNILKYLWCRPRPRFIFNSEYFSDPEAEFHPFWVLNPFAAFNKELTYGTSNNLKSFPSGHSTYASTSLTILPCLTLLSKKHKDNRKLQIILFYAGLAWSVMSMLSRVYAGAHFLSDVGMGLLVSVIVATLVKYFLFNPKATEEVKEEAMNV